MPARREMKRKVTAHVDIIEGRPVSKPERARWDAVTSQHVAGFKCFERVLQVALETFFIEASKAPTKYRCSDLFSYLLHLLRFLLS